eukprot:SAG11_NODE_1247_length_5401_cov_2.372878_13_plen_68_part_00
MCTHRKNALYLLIFNFPYSFYSLITLHPRLVANVGYEDQVRVPYPILVSTSTSRRPRVNVLPKARNT